MKNKALLFLCILLFSACHNVYTDTELEQKIRNVNCKETILLKNLTNYEWDTIRIAKPYETLEGMGIQNAPRALRNEIGSTGPREGTCVLIFTLKGKVVKYATIPYTAYDFLYSPDILTADITICKGWIAENIKTFYQSYIKDWLENTNKRESILKKYMRIDMRSKMQRLIYSTGGNPITRTQDIHPDMLETLDVKCLGNDWYMVSYLWDKNDSTSVTKIPIKARDYQRQTTITYITPLWQKSQYGNELLSFKFASELNIDHSSSLAFLKTFYQAYGTVYCTMFNLDTQLTELRSNHLSKNAIAQFKHAIQEHLLDGCAGYDLLFQDFDFDISSHKTMQFSHIKDNDYQMTYFKGKQTKTITITVKKVKNKYLIDRFIAQKNSYTPIHEQD